MADRRKGQERPIERRVTEDRRKQFDYTLINDQTGNQVEIRADFIRRCENPGGRRLEGERRQTHPKQLWGGPELRKGPRREPRYFHPRRENTHERRTY